MIPIRGAWIHARILHHRASAWFGCGLAAWVLLLWAQEPTAIGDIPYFWPGVEAALLLVLAALPLIWLAGFDPAAALLTMRLARSPLLAVASTWAGILGYGLLLSAATAAFCLALKLAFGMPSGPLPLPAALVLCAEALLVLAPLAAAAPGLASLQLSLPKATLAWVGVVGASFAGGIPAPMGSLLILQNPDPTLSLLDVRTAAASGLAALAGMLASTALAFRHRPS